jgi:general secretion pathway protein C
MQSFIFTRADKEYILKLESKQNSSKYVSKVQTRNANALEDEYSVSKNDIRYYSQHPTQIWRDIAISEIKKNGKIAGFRVNRIRPNSKMATIGLEVGDVIVKANNVELKSYRDAIKLYNEIDTIDVLELTVIRNNQEKEIVYEIH